MLYTILSCTTCVGNMSHDLKTPLAGLMNGLDVMHSTLAEVASGKVTSEAALGSIGSSVVDLRSISSFMLMTVNRCGASL